VSSRRKGFSRDEPNRVPCSVCDFQIDTTIQRVGGGAGDDISTFTDVAEGTATYDRGRSLASFGQLFEGAYGFGGGRVTKAASDAVTGFQSTVTRTSVCPFCGTDNWRLGSGITTEKLPPTTGRRQPR